MLIRATRRWTEPQVVRPMIVPVLAGTASATLGWFLSYRAGADLLSGLLGGTCAVLCFLTILLCLEKTRVLETLRFVAASGRAGAFGRDRRGAMSEPSEDAGPAVVGG